MNRHRMWWIAPCAAGALLGGCASPGTSNQKTAGPEAVNSGLSALRAEAGASSADGEPAGKPDIDRMTEDFGRGLEELDSLLNAPRRPADRSGRAGPGGSAASSAKPAETPGAGPAEETVAEEEPGPGAPTPDRAEMLRSAAAEAAGLLRAEHGDDPFALAVRLVSLRAATGATVAGLGSLVDGLPVEQRGAVLALDDVLSGASGGADGLVDTLAARSAALDESRPIEIAKSVLCSRVEAFGRYTELGRDGFVAGRPIPMIIYTEAAHFDRVAVPGSARGSMGDEAWEVKLGQEVLLYHESDGLLAWRRPEQVTVYRSKSRLHDFFLVDRVELPRTLTVGAYRLKIVLRDLHDGSVDERIIPIRVVADQNLTTGYGG